MIRACTLLVLPGLMVALLAPSAAAGWKHRHHGGGGVHSPHQRSGQFVQFLREAAPIAGDILRIVLVQPEGGGQPPAGDGGGVAENPNAPASAGEEPVTLSTS